MTTTTDRHVSALQSDLLSQFPFVRHGVTGRIPGLGLADGNVGFGSPRDKEDAWQMRQLFCASIGVDPHTLVTVGQVHGDDVRVVHAADAGKGATPDTIHLGLADALITDQVGVTLMTLHADCLMILLVDPVRPSVGVVHAGWRGTVVDIAGITIRKMQEAFDSDPAEIRAFLGPAICGVSNEVGPEVTATWREQAADLGDLAESAVTRPSIKEHFDVPRANELLLQRAGLRSEHIETSAACTKIQGDSWFSHRGQGPLTGRHGAIIGLVQS